ncbi:hypothetical protein [Cloacibacterium sp. TD35]|uniref:hypothetical protein n=1 Tax=Cloacibacterium sp. TD35 TaxID=2976818 RepID=UPI00237DA6FB|nr:hypothetical protein [Cloacibacterium sp. TD35]WDT67222.1 hypothetical protein N7277_07725 [Cloacibacterium sp. TD35]
METKYQELQNLINLKIQELQEKIKLHKINFEKNQTWGHIGDLELINKELAELVNSFK